LRRDPAEAVTGEIPTNVGVEVVVEVVKVVEVAKVVKVFETTLTTLETLPTSTTLTTPMGTIRPEYERFNITFCQILSSV